MKQKTSTEIKLTTILENMDRMPSRPSELNDVPKLSPEEKKKLLEMVGKFNDYGKNLQCEKGIVETAKALEEISKLAEVYACNEAVDWFDRDIKSRDFKNIKRTVMEFQKLAKECYSGVQKLSALYEDCGHIISRYYDIKDPNLGAINSKDIHADNLNSNSSKVMDENDLKAQRTSPENGPVSKQIKENDLKSQRISPENGPAPKQVKETNLTSLLNVQKESVLNGGTFTK